MCMHVRIFRMHLHRKLSTHMYDNVDIYVCMYTLICIFMHACIMWPYGCEYIYVYMYILNLNGYVCIYEFMYL